jgi:hypothetical protein
VVKVAQLAELRVVVPAVAGSNPVLHPIHAMHRPARAPAVDSNAVRVWRNW